MLGYQQRGEHDWYLVKDSGSKAFDGQHQGYYFYRGDWVKLKVLAFTVHRDAAQGVLEKFGS
ncbi:MAG: hypothetical protein B7733_16340 [Myxococcales bacterium FL481]|nr:MAG: hypothetical protein B7733_16340 [Myxococcales bacterium FL481]